MTAVDQPLCNIKWFDREVRQIVFRNLWVESPASEEESDNERNASAYRLDIFAENTENMELPIFNGCTICGSQNPSWAIDGLPTDSPEVVSGLIFVITEDVEESEGKISKIHKIEFIIELAELVSLGSTQLRNIESFPLNSIIFATDNGYYVTSNLYQSLLTSGPLLLTSRNIIAESESESLDITIMRSNMAESTERISELREQANTSLINASVQTEHIKKMNKIRAIQQLKAEVLLAEIDVNNIQEEENQERMFLADTNCLKLASEMIVRLTKDIDTLKTKNAIDETKLSKMLFLLEARQISSLQGLRRTYPLQLLESGDYSIRGAELPADCYSTNNGHRDDEQISTALGYTVHVLLLISKYFNIVLRYQLVFCGSRSTIGDDSVHHNGYSTGPFILPLYKKGIEKERFDRAVLWLKRDVQQILIFVGLEYDTRENILCNVDRIFLAYLPCENLIF